MTWKTKSLLINKSNPSGVLNNIHDYIFFIYNHKIITPYT